MFLRKADVPLVAAAAAGWSPGGREGGAEQRLAQLQAANERLEHALVSAHVGGDPRLDPSSAEDEDRDGVVELTVQLAQSRGELQAASERLAELEPQLQSAQVGAGPCSVTEPATLQGSGPNAPSTHTLRAGGVPGSAGQAGGEPAGA